MLKPPIEPMLAKLADELPAGDDILYEPKWDGFRAIVFRGDSDVFIQSRDLRPLDRYFPELHAVFVDRLPAGCVIDGEIVIAGPTGLDFDALQLRLHPAASRVAKLARETPAAFVGFDLLAVGGRDIRAAPQSERRARLEQLLRTVQPPIHLTPMTRDRAVAVEWLERFEGAGLDGVIAKPANGTYQPGKGAMIKVKHARTADCVVAGFRWHKSGKDTVGSLLLGLYDGKGTLHHIGVTSSFTMAMRKQLALELAPLGTNALTNHPWREWASDSPELRRASEASRAAAPGGGAPGALRNLPHARRPEPLERGERSLVGAAADRAGLRGEVRPPAGRSLSPRGSLPAMAAGQAAERLPLRSARGYEGVRAREGLRRGESPSLTRFEPEGLSSGSSGSCAGRSSIGTCCRLTRMRVHV
jgi:ATP dependent DNA ligase-like protein